MSMKACPPINLDLRSDLKSSVREIIQSKSNVKIILPNPNSQTYPSLYDSYYFIKESKLIDR